MKEQILALRAEGKSYKQISAIVGCSKSTAIYNCKHDEQKEKSRIRQSNLRNTDKLSKKVENLRDYYEKVRNFQRRKGSSLVPREEYNFSYHDLRNKIGEAPICYLSGEPININDGSSYNLDHIIPACRGGKNTLDNVGVCSALINKMKHTMTVDEFLEKCKQVLEYNGYIVTKEE